MPKVRPIDAELNGKETAIGSFIKTLCGKLTKHRFRHCYAYYEKEPDQPEYYCRCRLCHHRFWTDKEPKKLPKGD